ncbi:unannotated protein [freshwater metagenome]|uniref:Unannotated protein n=1 Tax=freshwater metagenome TaxID=449393 RepID=A0A6J6Z9R8_9ZZZZ|nr:mannosyltransferase [Actinomycetota bacterium]MSZ62891.1 mannosyltransferase [Actinomycetota bacterium]MTA19879.1 mannosyltransferase [Actinomycetota bacterium]
MRPTARVLIALAILASLFSFIKFSHCESKNWATPDQYVHACYSDLPSLFGDRELNKHKWAYAGTEKAVEYPVITGLVMYATALITPSNSSSATNYFLINAFLIALLFIFMVVLIAHIKPNYWYLLPVAPAMIASLYINWDLWAITSMLIAIYWFDKEKYKWSALALGISISTKFMPIFLLLPIFLILWRKNRIREIAQYSGIVIASWLAINLPVALTTPQGWWRFYDLNLSRGADWGSPWLAFSILGINLANLNYLTILALLAGLTIITLIFFEFSITPTLAQMSFILLAVVMIVSKVYSPQYVLWLTPLAILGLNKKSVHAFWIWQGGEVIYHIAIWQHLATVTGAPFGLPAKGYALLTLLRIATTIYLVAVMARRAIENSRTDEGRPHTRLFDFLFEASSSYP